LNLEILSYRSGSIEIPEIKFQIFWHSVVPSYPPGLMLRNNFELKRRIKNE